MTLTQVSEVRSARVAARMAEAADRFVTTLSERQRSVALFPFEGDERYAWSYRPDGSTNGGRRFVHEGLQLIHMTRAQQDLAFGLLGTGLSMRGASTVRGIMRLEPILREIEREAQHVNQFVRDPELFAFSVFGAPGGRDPWAWRVGGHHIGVHFTVVDGDAIASTPLFFGANPARVPFGPSSGYRPLAPREELALRLLASLTEAQRARAIVSQTAPRDIATDEYRQADPAALVRGITYGSLTGEQRGNLVELIRHYLASTTDEIAEQEWQRLQNAGLDAISFAWQGGIEPGQGHYYAVTGSTFMIELDNTQDAANHVHSVWRRFDGDWGEDLLALHYAHAHPA